jgi:hypothetical protein
MAMLIAVGGAALGSAAGIGSSAGWLIGSVVGSLMFPSGGGQESEGARLGDLAVSSSAYGAARTVGFGTIRQAGNIIWSEGIREQKNTTKVGGGKGMGGSSAKQTTYTYFCSFAVAFGEGEADDVLRIWADGNLIFDKTGSKTNTRMSGLSFRFYGGDDEQLPDSLIQADKGEENTPAFRGTCYIVFDDLALEKFGNRIPSITAEIAYNSNSVGTSTKSTQYPGGYTGYSYDSLAVDWDRQLAYVQNPAGNVLRRVNLATMVEDRQVSGEDCLDQTTGENYFQARPMLVMPDGGLVATINGPGGDNAEPIVRIDPNTLKETGRFGYGSSFGGWPNTAPLSYFMAPIEMFTPLGEKMWLFSASVYGTTFGLVEYPDFRYTWDSLNMVYPIAGRITSACRGKKGEGYGNCFFINCGTSYPETIYIHKVTVDASALSDLVRGTSNGAHVELLAQFTADELAPGETSFETCDGILYDQTDGNILFGFQRNSDDVWQYAKIDSEDGSIIWITDDLFTGPNDGSYWGCSRIQDDTFGYVRGNGSGVQLNTQTGEVLHNGTDIWTVGHGGYGGLYDSRTESFVDTVASGESSLIGRWFFGRKEGEGDTLGSIVQNLCGRAGLSSSDIDVSDIDSISLPGYAIGRQITARAAIETLTKMFLFDGVESDFILKFLSRGRDPVREITQEDMSSKSEASGDIITETHMQEVELPSVFSITYMDKNNDYTQNTHSAKRIVLPEPSMYSSNSENLSIAVAVSADTAKQQAEKILYSSWIERKTYACTLSWEHLDLDPTDVITIVLSDEASVQARIAGYDVGAQFAIEMSALAEDEAQYSSLIAAYAGSGVPEQVVKADTIVKMLLLDVPLLRDLDEPAGRVYSPLYYFMGGYSDGQFSSGALYKSTDEVAYEYEGSIISDMTWGSTVSTLYDPPFDNPFAPDTTNTLEVSMQSGGENLESVTTLQMLNGANAMAVVKTNGEIEVIQYRDVTPNGNNSYTLSYLLRGRRGTDTMSFNHTGGELVLMLSISDGQIHPLTIAELDAVRYYRGVGVGQLVEEAERITLSSSHRPLKPYAPVHLAAVLDGSDIDITWVRRTRVGGALIDYVGTVPLSEDEEEYELEIYDAPAGSLLRTVTGISTTEYTYTNADIITDFGSIPSQLTLKAYQISAQVSRGFSYEVTIDVE